MLKPNFCGLLHWTRQTESAQRLMLLDTAPSAVQEECDGGVEHDVTVEVFMGLVQHAAIVAGVNVVPPAILGGINVKLRHAHQTHLLVV